MEVFIIRNGEQLGPLDEQSVQNAIKEARVSPDDLAWSTGLPAWVPLKEVLLSRNSATPPPAPGESGISSSGMPPRNKATPKQRVFLSYLAIPYPGNISKEEAAILVSDALENPALLGRVNRWQLEKFRQHPDIFADEVEVRKKQRASTYLELCQIEGKDIVENITEAHCKVLVESLDNRFPSWEKNPRESLWDYFFPTVAEHFPQLVTEAWRGRLKIGGTKLPAAMTHASAKLLQPPAGPSQFQAAIRGLIYGLVVLGAIIGGIYFIQQKPAVENLSADAKRDSLPPKEISPSSPVATSDAVQKEPSRTAAVSAPASGADAVTHISAQFPAVPPQVDSASSQGEMTPGAPSTPAETASTDTSTEGQPVSEVGAPTPPKTTVTLRKAVEVQLQFGKVKLNAGTRLKYIATEGQLIRARFNNDELLLPASVTDMAVAPQ